MENLPQLIIGIVLIDSSRDSYLSQNISHYLQSNFISFVDKSKDKGLLLLDILVNWVRMKFKVACYWYECILRNEIIKTEDVGVYKILN